MKPLKSQELKIHWLPAIQFMLAMERRKYDGQIRLADGLTAAKEI